MRTPEFWYTSPDRPGMAAWALTPLGWFYGAGTRLRMAFGRTEKAAIPVICAGNVVAGGAGKTPVVLSLARRLSDRGRVPHILTRGHGGREGGPLRVDRARHSFRDVGDEALLLAVVAPTWVSRDRAAGARAAIAQGANVILMDDGLQNPGLAKDLSLLVVDGTTGFGNERLIPSGPLREPIGDALSRVQAVVAVGAGAEQPVAHLRARVAPLPLLEARFVPTEESRSLAGHDVVAFAGIGRPERFFHGLEALGCRVRDRHVFPDHHPFTAREIERIRARAQNLHALAVTTAKDAVRLSPEMQAGIDVFSVDLEWADAAALEDLLDRVGSPS